MRDLQAAADPDAAPRLVRLPADWDDQAAQALAALLPGAGAVTLADGAAHWIERLADDPAAGPELGRELASLLLLRQAAPGEVFWMGDVAAAELPFIVNLAGFVKPGSGFETERYADAMGVVAQALRIAVSHAARTGASPQPALLLTNLDACLAGLGLEYESEQARDVARCLVAAASLLARGSDADGQLSLVRAPLRCAVPGLAALAQGVHPAVPGPRIVLGFSDPGPVDALLGVEGCGLAPIFSPLRPDGRLSGSTLARLSGRGLTPEAALALSLAGDSVVSRPGRDAWLAMHRALSGLADRMPPLPEHQPALASGTATRRDMPHRRRGFTQKASVGGHRLFLQTGEFADGSLGEVALTPPRETPAMRGMMDAFGRAVSLGLQHGVPLDTYVEAFAYTRFGPAGLVEGDGSIAHATSLLDYAFRMLAEAYLGRSLPDAPHADGAAPDDDRPLLPLDLPEGPRARTGTRAGLRIVGGRG